MTVTTNTSINAALDLIDHLLEELKATKDALALTGVELAEVRKERDRAVERLERAGDYGTRSRYVRGCRCQECRKINTEYQRAWDRRVHGRAPQKYGRTLTHGTVYGYNQGCRCDFCRFAWRSYAAKRVRERPPLSPTDPRHGTKGGYTNHSCRCEACT